MIQPEKNLGFSEPDSWPALRLEDASNVELRMLLALAAEVDQPVVRFQDARDCFLQGCPALTRTRTWAAVEGTKASHLREIGNELSLATNQLELGSDVSSGAVRLEAAANR